MHFQRSVDPRGREASCSEFLRCQHGLDRKGARLGEIR